MGFVLPTTHLAACEFKSVKAINRKLSVPRLMVVDEAEVAGCVGPLLAELAVANLPALGEYTVYVLLLDGLVYMTDVNAPFANLLKRARRRA